MGRIKKDEEIIMLKVKIKKDNPRREEIYKMVKDILELTTQEKTVDTSV